MLVDQLYLDEVVGTASVRLRRSKGRISQQGTEGGLTLCGREGLSQSIVFNIFRNCRFGCLTYSLQLAEPLEQVDHGARLFRTRTDPRAIVCWRSEVRRSARSIDSVYADRQAERGPKCKFVDWVNLSRTVLSAKKLLRDVT